MGLMGVYRAQRPPKWVNGGFDRGWGGRYGVNGGLQGERPPKVTPKWRTRDFYVHGGGNNGDQWGSIGHRDPPQSPPNGSMGAFIGAGGGNNGGQWGTTGHRNPQNGPEMAGFSEGGGE